jgi:flagellar basal-body rod protein FlgF
VPLPAVDARIVQGAIEESNVQSVIEMTRMMQVLRDFQSAQKAVESEHSRARRMIQVLTGVN